MVARGLRLSNLLLFSLFHSLTHSLVFSLIQELRPAQALLSVSAIISAQGFLLPPRLLLLLCNNSLLPVEFATSLRTQSVLHSMKSASISEREQSRRFGRKLACAVGTAEVLFGTDDRPLHVWQPFSSSMKR